MTFATIRHGRALRADTSTHPPIAIALGALVALVALALAPLAAAQELRLEIAGSTALETTYARALETWEEALGGDLGSILTGTAGAAAEGADPAAAGPTARIELGDRGLLGPDVATLTLLEPGAPTTVLVASSFTSATYPALHELGLLLGIATLPPGTAPRVTRAEFPAAPEARPTEPSSADLSALRDTRRFAAEDLNRDGAVDFYDLLILAESYGARGFLPADLDGNGVVDAADLDRLRAAYSFAPPSTEAPAGVAGPGADAATDTEEDPGGADEPDSDADGTEGSSGSDVESP